MSGKYPPRAKLPVSNLVEDLFHPQRRCSKTKRSPPSQQKIRSVLHYSIRRLTSAVSLLQIVVFIILSSTVSSFLARASPRFSFLSAFSRLRMSYATKPTVGYVSDVEGNYEYWRQCVRESSVLNFGPGGEIVLRDHCQFVCGGDVCDRGDGDIRVLRDLVDLKKRYNDRVHFILGNRDVNKFRLPFTLHESALRQKPCIYWMDCSTQEEGKDYKLDDLTDRMKWTLKCTMGSPLSFECRRHELRTLGEPCDDESVAKSYLNLVRPGGLLFEYIKLGVMAVIIEDTLYVHGGVQDEFLGYVPPSRTTNGSYETDIFRWVAALNSFVREEVADYEARTDEYCAAVARGEVAASGWDLAGGYDHPQPGSRLVQCAMGSLADNSVNPTVIYTSYLRGGVRTEPAERTVDWMMSHGVTRMVVGHQPVGDSPMILANTRGLLVCSADTCYSRFVQYTNNDLWSNAVQRRASGTTPDIWMSAEQFFTSQSLPMPPGTVFSSAGDKDSAWKRADTRAPGCVAEVAVVIDDGDETTPLRTLLREADHDIFADVKPRRSTVVVQGTLSQGSKFNFALGADLSTSLVGRMTKDGWMVKVEGVNVPAAEGAEAMEYCQLGFSEGTTFKAKLLPKSEVLPLLADESAN